MNTIYKMYSDLKGFFCMKTKFAAFFISLIMMFDLFILPFGALGYQEEERELEFPEYKEDLQCKSAVLMDAATGTVLFAKNENEAYPPASVTKIMTLLLVMEEIERGNLKLSDSITASANACSMGGSQIYLKEGEIMSAEDMIKSVVISSANDAAVALAEHIAGSEEEFVRRMNERASELGMHNTNFENTNGLDDTAKNHKTSAYDIAVMSRELIKHKSILKYSSTWMDSIRGGAFGLTNTNRLVRFYRGCTGLKTGSTSKAGFCVSVTAQRDGLDLICVIMGAESGEIRNKEAAALLDFGFANYACFKCDSGEFDSIKIKGGMSNSISAYHESFCACVIKGRVSDVKSEISIKEDLSAPIKVGDVIGRITFYLDQNEIGYRDIICKEGTDAITFFEIFKRIFLRSVTSQI